MEMNHALRKELLDYFGHGRTHATFEESVTDFPETLINETIKGVPYSFWGLLEHIRMSQRDILDFVQNSNYQEMKWPEEFWPNPKETATKAMWDESILEYKKDSEAMMKIIKDPKADLFVPIPWGNGQTIFREAIQIIDHASYHLGELILMRRVKAAWKSK